MLPNPPTPVPPSTFRQRAITWKQIWNVVRFLMGFIGLIAVILYAAENDSLLETFLDVDLLWVFAAFVLHLVATFFKTVRWWLVLNQSKVEVSLQRLFGTYLVGTFFTQFMPGSSMGGDAMRMMEMGADSGRMMASVSSVLVERAIGLITIFISASALLIFFPNPKLTVTIQILVHSLAIVGTTGLIFLRMGWFLDPIGSILERLRLGKVAEKLLTLSKALQGHLGETQMLAKMVVLSFFANACTMTASYVGLVAVSEHVNYFSFIPLIALSVAIELVPVSPGALGLREATYIFFLGQLDVSESGALTAALIVRGVSLALGILGGFVLISRAIDNAKHQREKRKSTVEDEADLSILYDES